MFDGVAPLTQAVRDLAHTARAMTPLLVEMRGRRAGTAIEELGARLGLDPRDTARALVALELLGYVQPTHYKITDSGERAAKEE